MSYFKAKMHKIRFWVGLHPRSAGGAHSALLDSLAGFKGPTSKGIEGKGRRDKGKGRERTWKAGWGSPTIFSLKVAVV